MRSLVNHDTQEVITHASVCTGIGGFDLASDWMGWENLFTCEKEEKLRQALKYYWPNIDHYEDIRSDFTQWRGLVDVLTGGIPCQPFSQSGKRLGDKDDRHLWPEMFRVFREVRPRWGVVENVYGLVNWNGGMVFEQIKSDLESEGYEVFPFVLPACGVNAPHIRQRVWIIAKDTNTDGWKNCQRKEESKTRQQWDIGAGNNEPISSNNAETKFHTNSNGNGRKEASNKNASKEGRKPESRIHRELEGRLDRRSRNRITSNTDSIRPQGNVRRQQRGIQEINKPSKGQTLAGFFAARDGWEKFPTESPICSGDDGLSERLDGITLRDHTNMSLEAYGNAVSPVLVYQIFQAIQQYINLYGK